jgi:catabolite regulation protein CreA
MIRQNGDDPAVTERPCRLNNAERSLIEVELNYRHDFLRRKRSCSKRGRLSVKENEGSTRQRPRKGAGNLCSGVGEDGVPSGLLKK